MKVTKLKCSSCGATMQLNEEKNMARCPYCKNKILIQKEHDFATLKKQEHELGYAREMGKNRAAYEFEVKKKKNKFKKTVTIILIIVAIVGVALCYNYYSLPLVEDPFACATIKFSGIDGEGEIEVINNESCDSFNNIDFIASKEEGIKEGEKINVTAHSDKYRFGVKSKEYTVEGLSKYLTDLSKLDDNMIEKIHEFSYEHLYNKAFGITFSGEIVSLKPYKLYLYSNGSDSNILYDVYKTSIKTRSGKVFDKYVVAYYENFLLLSNKEQFSYSKLYHCGNIIKAGDPNVHTANSKDYVGNINGFQTIAEFNNYLNEDNDGSYEITER